MGNVADRQQLSNHSDITVNLYGTKITVTVTASGSVIDEWINTTLSHGSQFLHRRQLVVSLSIDDRSSRRHVAVMHRLPVSHFPALSRRLHTAKPP
ncbi:hypothetical protein A2U01_0033558 [Trifolium medium]|uniref:Uncharacterized protein n=1 Tax=Trifolium medium TaxID=97028 RepID=A0A392PK41_9FABA|nr:hypothetical protein [Trifolium medium]